MLPVAASSPDYNSRLIDLSLRKAFIMFFTLLFSFCNYLYFIVSFRRLNIYLYNMYVPYVNNLWVKQTLHWIRGSNVRWSFYTVVLLYIVFWFLLLCMFYWTLMVRDFRKILLEFCGNLLEFNLGTAVGTLPTTCTYITITLFQ